MAANDLILIRLMLGRPDAHAQSIGRLNFDGCVNSVGSFEAINSSNLDQKNRADTSRSC